MVVGSFTKAWEDPNRETLMHCNVSMFVLKNQRLAQVAGPLASCCTPCPTCILYMFESVLKQVLQCSCLPDWGLLLLCIASIVHAAVVISDPNLISRNTYDYIVVGGGLAGLTVGCVQFSYSFSFVNVPPRW